MKRIRPWIEPQFSQIYADPEIPILGLKKLPIIIGLTGPTRCGKTIMAERLVTKYGFQYVSHVNFVTSHAIKQGVEDLHWMDLNRIAMEMRSSSTGDVIVRLLIDKMRRERVLNGRIVIDALNHQDEIEYLSSFPNFHLVGVVANIRARAKAAATWYGKTEATHLRAIKYRDIEEQYEKYRGDQFGTNIGKCIKLAEKKGIILRVKGDLSKSTIYDRIDEVAEKLLSMKMDRPQG